MPHRPKKSLGQNFLVDGNFQKKIVQALHIEADDEVLEIGPDKGALTRHLVGSCRSLILVELDRELAGDLQKLHQGNPAIQVLNQDILQLHPEAVSPNVQELKVVGNIPYNITSPILFHLLTPPRPKVIVIMVQKEVGERILAQPGTSAFGALTVGVQTVAGVKKVLKVPASAFRPVPAVDSLVLEISPHSPPLLSPREGKAVRSLTRTAFQQRRKQFQSILRRTPDWTLSHDEVGELEERTGFDLAKRPETFSPPDFVFLSKALSALRTS